MHNKTKKNNKNNKNNKNKYNGGITERGYSRLKNTKYPLKSSMKNIKKYSPIKNEYINLFDRNNIINDIKKNQEIEYISSINLDNIINEENIEEEYNDEIKARFNNSGFMEKIMSSFIEIENKTIIEYINEMLYELNSYDDVCAVIYGGRAWNYNFGEYKDKLNFISKSCILAGNIDILIITNNENYNIKMIEDKIMYINELIKEAYLKLVNNYGINELKQEKYTELGRRTISTNGISYKLNAIPITDNIEIVGVTTRRNIQTEIIHLRGKYDNDIFTEIQIKNNDSRLIAYFEIGIQKYFDIQQFKKIFIEKNYLNLDGLLLFSNFIDTKRKQEKIIDVDKIRDTIYKIYSKPSNINMDYIQHQVAELMFVKFPIIFPCNINTTNENELKKYDYSHHQARIFLSMCERYNCKVEYNNNSIGYNDFMNNFNNDIILDSNGGGNGEDLPSLRQLLQWIITGINTYDNNICKISGGDALRRYDTNIKVTADIDCKYYYTTSKKNNTKILYDNNNIRKIIILLVILQRFLETNRYFRFKKIYPLKIYHYNFNLIIDTRNQEIISKLRFMMKFIKPLISIDLRFSCSIEYTQIYTKNIENSNISSLSPILEEEREYNIINKIMKIKTKIYTSPLDIVFWENKDKQEKTIFTIPEDFIFKYYNSPYNTNTTTTTLFKYKLLDNNNTLQSCFTPTFSFVELMDDVNKMTLEPMLSQRIAAGKHEKDIKRLKSFEDLYKYDDYETINKYKNEQIYINNNIKYIYGIPEDNIVSIEQIEIIPVISNKSKMMNLFFYMIYETYKNYDRLENICEFLYDNYFFNNIHDNTYINRTINMINNLYDLVSDDKINKNIIATGLKYKEYEKLEFYDKDKDKDKEINNKNTKIKTRKRKITNT